jgi:hypothetical protein
VKYPTFQLQYDPAKIPKLAEKYMEISGADDRRMEDAGKRITHGDFSRSNLEIICGWKSHRRVRLLDKNTNVEIEKALKGAIGATNVKDAVGSLETLAGVGVKMASAILTAIDPERYCP